MADIKVEKSMFQRYAEFKVEFGKLPLKKSGRNDYQKYEYFELSDFSNIADEYLLKHGLVYIGPSWVRGEDGTMWVTARIYDLSGMQYIEFRVEEAKSEHSSNPIQNAGGTITYWKRYMKSLACDLIENDEVDAVDNGKEVKATAKQIELIKNLYDEENISKMLEYYKVQKLEDMSVKNASDVIARKKK